MKTEQHTQLSKIPKGNYEGYLWNASQQKPEIFEGTEEINVIDKVEEIHKNSDEKLVPIIIEGLLYDREHKRSIHIIYTHRYMITVYELENGDEFEEQEYMPHNRLKEENVKSIKMARVWAEKQEEEMPTLTLIAHIFRGFNFKK